jgi:hypothetical protein
MALKILARLHRLPIRQTGASNALRAEVAKPIGQGSCYEVNKPGSVR